MWPLARELSERSVPYAFISADCTQENLPYPFQRMVCLEKPATTDEIVDLISELATSAA